MVKAGLIAARRGAAPHYRAGLRPGRPGRLDALDALDETPFHRLCAEFPADPAARLPLERIKPGLVISLGVVDVSTAEPEPVDMLPDRVDPAAERRGEGDVAIATNSGFAASADLPLMTEEEQNTKLRLVETVAPYYLGKRDLSPCLSSPAACAPSWPRRPGSWPSTASSGR